jgi:nitronate monooxygenase
MATLRTPLCDLLGIDLPIIQAPMAGGATTPDLVAAVSAAGALGSFGHTFSATEAMRADAAAVRSRTGRPFALNLFATPIPAEPPVAAQRPAIEALRDELESRHLAVPERVPPPYAPGRRCSRPTSAISRGRRSPGSATREFASAPPPPASRRRGTWRPAASTS